MAARGAITTARVASAILLANPIGKDIEQWLEIGEGVMGKLNDLGGVREVRVGEEFTWGQDAALRWF